MATIRSTEESTTTRLDAAERRSSATAASNSTATDTDSASEADPRFHRLILVAGMVAIGIGLAVNSVAGPFLVDAIDYPVSASMRNQTVGLDAAALFLVAPACLAVAALAWRGHALAPVLVTSLGSYVAYMFLQYLVGPEFDYYPATLVLHLGLFAAGWMLAAQAWRMAQRRLASAPVPGSRHAIVALILAGFVTLRYLPGLAASLTEDPVPEEVAGDITMYWLILLSDLGIFVPITIATALGIRRGAQWAGPALAAILGWFVLVSVAVTAMSFTMIVNDDPFASRAQLGLFVVITAAAVAYAGQVYRALSARGGTRAAQPAP